MNFKDVEIIMTPRSPFARRVLECYLRHDLNPKITLVEPFTATQEQEALFLASNPLGLVPAIQLSGGHSVQDSQVILDLFDKAVAQIWPSKLEDRAVALKLSNLSTGIMTLAVHWLLEKNRTHPDPGWLKDDEESIKRTLNYLAHHESEFVRLENAHCIQPSIDLAIALGYLEFRFKDWTPRHSFESLNTLYRRIARSPSFVRTAPPLSS